MIEPTIVTLAVLFTIAFIISITAERLHIPAAAALVAVGAGIHTTLHIPIPFHFGPALLYIFLPPLIFEAAWNIDQSALIRNAGRILLLALPGTVVTAGIIAAVLGLMHALSWPSALLFGSIVAATDPVAIVGVFRRITIPIDVRTMIEGESLANDGIAVALFTVALSITASTSFDPATLNVGSLIIAPLLNLCGGLIVGATAALPVALALRATRVAEYEVAATIALAYLAYLVAVSFHLSGIFATAGSAIMLRGLLTKQNLFLHRHDVEIFWSAGAAIANTVLFFLTGLLIDPASLIRHPLIVLASVSGLIASRALIALSNTCEPSTKAVIFLAGMRGALPIALALSLPATIVERTTIFDGVATAVILTIVIQGAPLEPMLRWIYRRVD